MVPNTFLTDFHQAGFSASNERELTERLNEARDWQNALLTLLKYGSRIGLRFSRTTSSTGDVATLAQALHLRPAVARQLRLI